jgi:hypothetical protein
MTRLILAIWCNFWPNFKYNVSDRKRKNSLTPNILISPRMVFHVALVKTKEKQVLLGLLKSLLKNWYV